MTAAPTSLRQNRRGPGLVRFCLMPMIELILTGTLNSSHQVRYLQDGLESYGYRSNLRKVAFSKCPNGTASPARFKTRLACVIFNKQTRAGSIRSFLTDQGVAMCHTPLLKPSPVVSPGALSFFQV
jgi:hypothetical protein